MIDLSKCGYFRNSGNSDNSDNISLCEGHNSVIYTDLTPVRRTQTDARQTDRQSDARAHTHKDRQTNRQTDRQTDR
jgi:hypothetical protein